MSSQSATGMAKKEYAGPKEKTLILGIRVPRVRLTNIGATSISLPSPPRMLMLVATYIGLFLLMGGMIYVLIRKPIALGAQNNQPLYFYPSLSEAFIIEGFIASTLLFIAGAGAILTYQASLAAMNKSYAVKLLVIGISMTFVAFMVLQWVISLKT